jgi:hypothetical protein
MQHPTPVHFGEPRHLSQLALLVTFLGEVPTFVVSAATAHERAVVDDSASMYPKLL